MAKAALTITADDKSKVYGATDPALTATYSGLQYKDTASVVTGFGMSTVTGAAATYGTHDIVATGGTAANYDITDVDGTLAVAKAALTITADDKSKVYGATDPALTATYAGLQYTDTSAVVTGFSMNTTTGTAATVGTHPIEAVGGTALNYAITDVNGILTVTQNGPTQKEIEAEQARQAAINAAANQNRASNNPTTQKQTTNQTTVPKNIGSSSIPLNLINSGSNSVSGTVPIAVLAGGLVSVFTQPTSTSIATVTTVQPTVTQPVTGLGNGLVMTPSSFVPVTVSQSTNNIVSSAPSAVIVSSGSNANMIIGSSNGTIILASSGGNIGDSGNFGGASNSTVSAVGGSGSTFLGSSFTSLISSGGSGTVVVAGSVANSAITTPQPTTAVDYFAAGNAQLTSGNSATAITAFSKAIELNPNYAEAYLNRGMAELSDTNKTAAKQDITKAIELDPALKSRLSDAVLKQLNLLNPIDPNSTIKLQPNVVYNNFAGMPVINLRQPT